jgi:hypothetical protein
MRRIPPTLIGGLLLLASPHAAAWVHYQVSDDDGNLHGLHWDSACFYYSLNEDGSDDIPFDELSRIVDDCFAVWEAPACSSFVFEGTAPTPVSEIVLNQDGDLGNANIIVFREEAWTRSSAIVAYTDTQYSRVDGKIYGIDMAFNGVHFTFADEPSYPEGTDVFDLRNTLIHEIGHTVGLDHTPVREATMHASATPGETLKRDLHQDDIDGLCALYPAADEPPVCEEPYCGLDLTGSAPCVSSSSSSRSCAAVAPGPSSIPASALFAFLRLI